MFRAIAWPGFIQIIGFIFLTHLAPVSPFTLVILIALVEGFLTGCWMSIRILDEVEHKKKVLQNQHNVMNDMYDKYDNHWYQN